jgi:hypothetical protein
VAVRRPSPRRLTGTGVDHLLLQGQLRRVGRAADRLRCNAGDLHEAVLAGAAGRPYLRLFDYRRLVQPAPACAILLPARPREDIEELLKAAQISAIWKEGNTFVDNANGAFV